MSLKFEPLTPDFGAEIFGVNLIGNSSDSLIEEILDLWNEVGGLIVIRDQILTSEDHINFSRNFGPLFGDLNNPPLQDTVSRYIHPHFPQIYRVSNQTDNKGEPIGRKGAGTYWHSDVSFRECPAQASILHGKVVPPVGGDTIFANQTKAYSSLSKGMKSIIDSLSAWHDFEIAARTQYATPILVEDDIGVKNRALHPIVRTHAVTGKKSLYVNPGFTSHIEGFNNEESELLLEFLYEHCIRPEFLHRHRWKKNDLLIWDNRTTMHYAVMDYQDDQPRYMERCTVIGERPA